MKQTLLATALLMTALMLACGGGSQTPVSGIVATTPPQPSGGGTGSPPSCDASTTGWVSPPAAVTPVSGSRFSPTSFMEQPRAGHTATLLTDGTVLLIDGGQLDIDDLLVSFAEAEKFDPATGIFVPSGKPCVAREFSTATLLKDGRVLVSGGLEFSGYPTWLPATDTTELYDPTTATFSMAAKMTASRSLHTATLLNDGRVLIVGGSTTKASAEIYDPIRGTFTPTSGTPSFRLGHTATLLASGEVLIVGGQDLSGAVGTAELFDPKTNSFISTGSMGSTRAGHTATLLADGRVLIAGGGGGQVFGLGFIQLSAIAETTAEIYDPQTGMFSPTATMHTGRIGHTATLLADGTVLLTGGFKDYRANLGYESYSSAEIYDPSTASFSVIAPMNVPRLWHTATLLRDGSVLVTGGVANDIVQSSAEIYK